MTSDTKTGRTKIGALTGYADRLESFGIYRLARRLFKEFGNDSEIPGKDCRGREWVKQQIRSLDSICANREEGFGRGFGRELPQHLKLARGEAKESRGRHERFSCLLSPEVVAQRISALAHIIGGLSKTIQTMENRSARAT